MPTTVTREAVQTRVFAALEEFGADADEITLEATFEELDVDSLDLVELGQIVQEEYGVELKGEDMPKLKTVGDSVDLITERAGA
jgi:acyl carrier protein